MELNVVNQWPSMELSSCGKVKAIKISIAIVILKVTAISFPKVTFELDSGLEIVKIMAMQMLTVVGTQYLAL